MVSEPEESDTIKLKVGRAVNVVKRIDQWGKQCGSKEHVLRGFYPGSVEPDEASFMKGRVIAGEQGHWCHKLGKQSNNSFETLHYLKAFNDSERLIHLELAELVSSCIYLDPKWPNIEIDVSSSGSEAKSKNSNARKPCVDCGSMHKEIFEFKRWKYGNGREWDGLVKPVIERWGKFVELYV